MYEAKNLAIVRRIEEELQREAHENATFDLTNLVAVFTQRGNGPWLAVFNLEAPPALPGFSETLPLKQLPQYQRDLSAEYGGIVITFDALGLIRPDIVTRGSQFYPIEQLYRRINQASHLLQTQWNLARTLFSILLATGELEKSSPEYSTTTWLNKTARLFRLSLPALLERHQLEGLVAVVPHENFEIYLDQQRYSLVYVTADGLVPNEASLLDLEHFAHISTDTQLCAAFSEVALFNEGIKPKTAGFVDLRKELRRSYYSADIRCIKKRSEDIKTTIKQLALLCYQRSLTERNFTHPVLSLSIEYWLDDQELDDIAAIELTPEWTELATTSSVRSYYLTLPESAPDGVASLDDLFRGRIKVDADNPAVSLHSLRPLFSSKDGHWLQLTDALLKLDRPQVLARSAYLTSRLLFKMPNSPINVENIIDEAAVACHLYSLAEPYHYYWPRGDHRHHMLQSYQNFHEQLDKFLDRLDDRKNKNYYHALKNWWDYQEHNFEQRKKLLEDAVKELESIIPVESSEDGQQYTTASQLYELFSAILRMFSRAWQPARLRERLLQTGYDRIVRDNVINSWNVLDIRLDPKQPSPLFLDRLRDFINLCEMSYEIRIKEHDPYLKAEKLTEVGAKLGQHIGLNFDKYMRRYRESHMELQTGGAGAVPYETEIDLSEELDDPLLLPEHERLWMRSFYYSAIGDLAAIIHTLQSRPVHGKITPTEVTQYESTVIGISLIGKMEEMIDEEKDVEVILSISKDYEIRSRIVRKRFGTSQPVEFTVAFRTSGDVALLFEYIIDNKKHFFDEAWVYVIELETQTRWIGNPYQYGTEIVNPVNHYGRRQELEKVLNHLRAMARGGERQNFRLHGIRRSGKTSLLHMIRRVIEDLETRRYYHIPKEMNSALDKWHPVFYSLQRLPYDTDARRGLNSKVFFRSLTEQICKSFHWTDEAIHTILLHLDAALTRSADIVGVVEAQLEQIFEELHPDEYILILLDEVDLIDIEKDSRFFGQLRSIINSLELTQIVWILTSMRVLQAPGEGVESPLHNIFAPIVLRNLDVTEARRLILERAHQENIYFEPEATESILQQTGRQPFFLQVVCSTIVDQLRIKQTSYVSKTLADAVMKQLLEPGTAIHDQCQLLWDLASESSKVILSLLAQHKQGMLKRELIEQSRAILLAQRHNSDMPFINAWEDLRANDLVSQDQDDFCRLTIPLFQQWLKQRDPDPYNPR